jgi:hypothetical protein
LGSSESELSKYFLTVQRKTQNHTYLLLQFATQGFTLLLFLELIGAENLQVAPADFPSDEDARLEFRKQKAREIVNFIRHDFPNDEINQILTSKQINDIFSLNCSIVLHRCPGTY